MNFLYFRSSQKQINKRTQTNKIITASLMTTLCSLFVQCTIVKHTDSTDLKLDQKMWKEEHCGCCLTPPSSRHANYFVVSMSCACRVCSCSVPTYNTRCRYIAKCQVSLATFPYNRTERLQLLSFWEPITAQAFVSVLYCIVLYAQLIQTCNSTLYFILSLRYTVKKVYQMFIKQDVDEWMISCMNVQFNELSNEWKNKWMNVRTNERTNEFSSVTQHTSVIQRHDKSIYKCDLGDRLDINKISLWQGQNSRQTI